MGVRGDRAPEAQPMTPIALRRTASRCFVAATIAAALLAAAAFGGLVNFDHRPSGVYDEVDGAGRLEFKGSTVYATPTRGMTFASHYSVDGDLIVLKAEGGSQVYRRNGEALEGGMGM